MGFQLTAEGSQFNHAGKVMQSHESGPTKERFWVREKNHTQEVRMLRRPATDKLFRQMIAFALLITALGCRGASMGPVTVGGEDRNQKINKRKAHKDPN